MPHYLPYVSGKDSNCCKTCNELSKGCLQDVLNILVVIPLSNSSPCRVLVKVILVSLDEINQQGVFLQGTMDFLLAKETGSA